MPAICGNLWNLWHTGGETCLLPQMAQIHADWFRRLIVVMVQIEYKKLY